MKKNLLITAGSVIVVLAIVAMAIFVMVGEKPEQAKELSLEGTWRVVSYVNGDTASAIENEYMVFGADNACDYRDGAQTPAFESAYTLSGTELVLSDISRKYTAQAVTDNIIRLYESKDVYMNLVKYADKNEVVLTAEDMMGKWDVVLHAGSPTVGESLDFKDDGVDIYRNAETEPSVSSAYSLDGNLLQVEALGLKMSVHKVSDNTIVLVETDTCYNWELTLAD